MTNKVTQTELVTQGSYFYTYTSKKVTSKLRKANYLQEQLHKHNVYEINNKLMKGNAIQRDDKDDTMIFVSRFTCLPTR